MNSTSNQHQVVGWSSPAGRDGRAFPLAWFAKKQKRSAGSTTEAEIDITAVGAREETIPLQGLVELALDMQVPAEISEDNQATIAAIKKG